LFSDSHGTAHHLSACGEDRFCASPLPAGWGLGLCFVLSLLAIVVRTPLALGAVTALDGTLFFLYRVRGRILRRFLRLFLWQTALLAVLYLLRFGVAEGLGPALRTSWQLLLVFVPGIVVVGSTSQTELVRALARVLSHRTAFVLSVSLKFVPLLLREMKAIYEAQVLRGARILRRDLVNPRNWPDLVHCLIAPTVVRAMVLADEIARAARAREFGRYPSRTEWLGDPEVLR
jgi:energy-coupling factor transport system permease protein